MGRRGFNWPTGGLVEIVRFSGPGGFIAFQATRAYGRGMGGHVWIGHRPWEASGNRTVCLHGRVGNRDLRLKLLLWKPADESEISEKLRACPHRGFLRRPAAAGGSEPMTVILDDGRTLATHPEGCVCEEHVRLRAMKADFVEAERGPTIFGGVEWESLALSHGIRILSVRCDGATGRWGDPTRHNQIALVDPGNAASMRVLKAWETHLEEAHARR